MYPFILFCISAICFFGGLISVIMALTGEGADSWEHWKNAAIYGAIAPLSMFGSVRLFLNSLAVPFEDETEEERAQRLEDARVDAGLMGIHAVQQGVFMSIGTTLVLILQGLNPLLSFVAGGGCILFGFVTLLVSLSKTATNVSAMLGRAVFVVFLGSQVALAFVTLILVVIIQLGFLDLAN